MPTASFASPLLTWFDAAERPLAWRNDHTSAWGVLLSEVMSQQTPVARVEPIWREWMQRWPDPAAFAQESPSEILRAWGTLGYPRRALRLHECGKAIVDRHAGEVPSAVDELLALPGIGEYTARAVACFAFQRNVPVVDTNVRRVLYRAVHGKFLQGTAKRSDLVEVEALLPEDGSGPRFSAALMELGALVCVARTPRCEACPIRAHCAWQQAGCPAPSDEEASAARKRVQKFAGTDRQVRGKIMAVLRASDSPVEKSVIDEVWPDAAQRSRALFSLLEDGLADQLDDGRFSLPS